MATTNHHCKSWRGRPLRVMTKFARRTGMSPVRRVKLPFVTSITTSGKQSSRLAQSIALWVTGVDHWYQESLTHKFEGADQLYRVRSPLPLPVSPFLPYPPHPHKFEGAKGVLHGRPTEFIFIRCQRDKSWSEGNSSWDSGNSWPRWNRQGANVDSVEASERQDRQDGVKVIIEPSCSLAWICKK
jgi:hypothetical protein